MLYYTSDLHLYHERILENRPFKDLGEMHNRIIYNWIQKVDMNDTVFILGDIGMYHTKEISKILQCLPGKKILITGNHDPGNLKDKRYKNCFAAIYPYKNIKDKGREVILCHYPIEDWDRRREGSYHLHGHIHKGRDQISEIPNRFNVNVEYRNYEPVTLDELIES